MEKSLRKCHLSFMLTWSVYLKKCTHFKIILKNLFTNCSFDLTKNKLDCYAGKGCMEKFCKNSNEHATKIIMKKKRYH